MVAQAHLTCGSDGRIVAFVVRLDAPTEGVSMRTEQACFCESSLCDHDGPCGRAADPRLVMAWVGSTCTQCAANMCATDGGHHIDLAPCGLRSTARSVHTGFPMSAEQRTVSALRATNVHARSVHCRRASMYVHPGDHSRRFGPERERERDGVRS